MKDPHKNKSGKQEQPGPEGQHIYPDAPIEPDYASRIKSGEIIDPKEQAIADKIKRLRDELDLTLKTDIEPIDEVAVYERLMEENPGVTPAQIALLMEDAKYEPFDQNNEVVRTLREDIAYEQERYAKYLAERDSNSSDTAA